MKISTIENIDSSNIREFYEEFIKVYTSGLFNEAIRYCNLITDFIDKLHPIQCTSIHDIISKVYTIKTQMLLDITGMPEPRQTEMQENDKKIYYTCIHLLKKVLSIDPLNDTCMELYKNVFLYIVRYNENIQENITYLKQILFYYPYNFEVQYNLGCMYQRNNDLDNALQHFKMAMGIIDLHLQSNGKYTRDTLTQFKGKCLDLLGMIYYSIQDRHLALYYLKLALRLLPHDPDIHNQLGVVFTELRDIKNAKIHYKLGIHYATKNMPETNESEKEVKDTLLSSMYMNMGLCICYECDFVKSIECYNKALSIKPRLSLAYQNKLLDLNYISHLITDEMYISEMHKNLNNVYKVVVTDYKQSLPDYVKKGNEKLNIGFVSGDFICHPVSYFVSNILKNFDTAQFNLFCYTCKIINGESEYPNCKWVLIKGTSPEQLSDMIKKDKIDVLFDLSGHTGDNRLDTFVLKPAPIQISYCGYPGTSGIKSIDYHLTDKYCDSQETQKYYQEKLVFLDHCFLNYTQSIPLESIPLKTQEKTHITFGCFNRYNKINKRVIRTWSDILIKAQTAKLLVKTREFLTKELQTKFLNEFTKEIRARIEILPFSDSYGEHLLDYNLIDISLDTFPYAGATTSCESLLMGVPVVTLRDTQRKYHCQNVTSSLLINSDMSEYVSDSIEEYVKKAVELSNEYTETFKTHNGKTFKEMSRDKFTSGHVYNHKEFVETFFKTIRHVYDNHKW